MVDDEDYEYLNGFTWKKSVRGYPIRSRGKFLDMHRVIINHHRFKITKPEGTHIDHKNRNKLDNQKENLRFATPSNNQSNRVKYAKNSTSKYKGVYKPKRASKWIANIRVNGKQIHIGSFENEVEAAKAYNEAALKYHGEFACINEI